MARLFFLEESINHFFATFYADASHRRSRRTEPARARLASSPSLRIPKTDILKAEGGRSLRACRRRSFASGRLIHMSNTLDFENCGEYAFVTLGGVRTPEALMEAGTAIISYCLEHSLSRLLIDVRAASGSLDTLEIYEVAGHGIASRENARQVVRSAILDRTENLERVRFFETVAMNRGINVRVFDDRTEAESWLLREENQAGS